MLRPVVAVSQGHDMSCPCVEYAFGSNGILNVFTASLNTPKPATPHLPCVVNVMRRLARQRRVGMPERWTRCLRCAASAWARKRISNTRRNTKTYRAGILLGRHAHRRQRASCCRTPR